jgi:hypothetical protein
MTNRESYIRRAWGNPIPERWTAELEAELPAELQDWSQFPHLASPASSEAQESSPAEPAPAPSSEQPRPPVPELLRGLDLPPNFRIVSPEEAKAIAIIGARPPRKRKKD